MKKKICQNWCYLFTFSLFIRGPIKKTSKVRILSLKNWIVTIVFEFVYSKPIISLMGQCQNNLTIKYKYPHDRNINCYNKYNYQECRPPKYKWVNQMSFMIRNNYLLPVVVTLLSSWLIVFSRNMNVTALT